MIGGAGIGLATGIFGSPIAEFGNKSLGAFNKKVLQDSAPPGVTITKTGHAGIQQLQAAWDDAYTKLGPKLNAPIDNQLVSDLQGIRNAMKGEGFTDDEVQRFWNIIDGQIIQQGQAITGDAVQRVQWKLGKLSVSRKDISEPVGQARQVFFDAVERGSPDAAGELTSLRQSYPKFVVVTEAAAKATADSGEFTPGQLATASRVADRSAHDAASAAGVAPHQQAALEAPDAGLEGDEIRLGDSRLRRSSFDSVEE